MWSENVIGPDGIQLQATVKKADGTLDKATNKAIEEAWADFSMPENASVDGLLSLTDMAALAIEMKKQDGESLIRIWAGFDNRHAYSLQILDADVLDHTYNRSAGDGQNEIRMGVERNKWGKPVAYHLWSSHPTDYFYAPVRERVRVPANEIIHLYSVKRPGQTRGITAFAPVMSDINMLAGYQEAELVAARGAAASMGFIYEDEEAEGEDPDAPTSIPTEAEPGTFQRLPSGLKVQQYSPEHPVAAFGAFCAGILRSIASGLSVAYSSLTGDLTGANYGSLRDGSLKERDAYRKEQNWVAIQLYRRIYLQWMKYATLSGRAQAADAQHGALHRAQLARSRLAVDRSRERHQGRGDGSRLRLQHPDERLRRERPRFRGEPRDARPRGRPGHRARRRARHRRSEDCAGHEHGRRRHAARVHRQRRRR
jgi:lambda family phage portal protein